MISKNITYDITAVSVNVLGFSTCFINHVKLLLYDNNKSTSEIWLPNLD